MKPYWSYDDRIKPVELTRGVVFMCGCIYGLVQSGTVSYGLVRVLTNSKFGLFYSNFLILTPTFSAVPIKKFGKTPNFSGRQHFYSYFQNPSENSACTIANTIIHGYDTRVSFLKVLKIIHSFHGYTRMA